MTDDDRWLRILLGVGFLAVALGRALHDRRRTEALARARVEGARTHYAGVRVLMGDWTKAEALRWLRGDPGERHEVGVVDCPTAASYSSHRQAVCTCGGSGWDLEPGDGS